MAFENLTFYEANELCRKSYISKDEFLYNAKDFPTLKKEDNSNLSQKTLDGTIHPTDRRSQAFKNGAIKRSYQHVASTDNNKKESSIRVTIVKLMTKNFFTPTLDF